MMMALCSDDPVYMENETLTDDYFAAAVGWNLGVADIKQLAINSIQYSGLSQKEKTEMLKAYSVLWDAFIDETLKADQEGKLKTTRNAGCSHKE